MNMELGALKIKEKFWNRENDWENWDKGTQAFSALKIKSQDKRKSPELKKDPRRLKKSPPRPKRKIR